MLNRASLEISENVLWSRR